MRRGFTCGVFDLFHPGHALMLAECKKYCEHLTVAVNTAEQLDSRINPNKRRPVFTPEERALMLRACRYVDEVCFYHSETELAALMRGGLYDLRFLGDDYRGRPITAPEAIAQIHYVDRSHGYSTTAMISRICTREPAP